MTPPSPCVGTCKLDPATGWCLGCARTGDEIADWQARSDASRIAVWEALPSRFEQLGVACSRLPCDTDEIRSFVVRTLLHAQGTWVVGVVGAVAELIAKPGGTVDVHEIKDAIVATTDGGALRFEVNDDVRALTFDPPDTPPERQRIVLAVKRERGRPDLSDVVTDLGSDEQAVCATDRSDQLFDLGLGRKEARFCVRCEPGAALNALKSAGGIPLHQAIHSLSPILVEHSPVRVVESALGRIEVSTPIPPPGGKSPAGPHTHLLPDHLATGRALPVGMDLPRAYWPGAIFYPRRCSY